MSGEVTRLLVRAPNWLGDAVLALPALGAIRRAYAGRAIVIAAAPSIAPLFEEVTPAAPDQIVVIDRAGEAAKIRTAGADAALLLTNSFRTAWAARMARVPQRCGYATAGRGFLLTKRVRPPRGRVHQTEYYRRLVSGLGIETGDDGPRLEPRPRTSERAGALLRRSGVAEDERLVGFAPGAAYGHAKRWPPDRVAGVIAALSARGLTAVLVGAAGDRETGRAIESALPAGTRIVNLIGRTTLGELIA